MLDTYRELAQRGARVTQEADHLRVEWPNGGAWLFFENHREYHGPRILSVLMRECPPPLPWWVKFWGVLTRWLFTEMKKAPGP